MKTERTHLFADDWLPTHLMPKEPEIKLESALCVDGGMASAVSPLEIKEIQRLLVMAMQKVRQLN